MTLITGESALLPLKGVIFWPLKGCGGPHDYGEPTNPNFVYFFNCLSYSFFFLSSSIFFRRVILPL